MFSVYGVAGRLITGNPEQIRQVPPVRGAPGARRIEREAPSSITSPPSDPPVQPAGVLSAYAQAQSPTAQRQPLTRVEEVMSERVFSLPQNTPVRDAWQQLNERGVGQAPVLDPQFKLVGMLLRADMLRPEMLPGPGVHPTTWASFLAQPVSAVMWSPVPGVNPHADLRRVAEVLLDTGLPGLPVIDDAGRVLGFITRSDILRAVAHDPPLDLWG